MPKEAFSKISFPNFKNVLNKVGLDKYVLDIVGQNLVQTKIKFLFLMYIQELFGCTDHKCNSNWLQRNRICWLPSSVKATQIVSRFQMMSADPGISPSQSCTLSDFYFHTPWMAT